MKIKQYTFYKEHKRSLPQYQNVTAGFGVTIDVDEGEKIDKQKIWTLVTNEIMENATIEAEWLEAKDAGAKRARFAAIRKEQNG